jgi:hypothetical protein
MLMTWNTIKTLSLVALLTGSFPGLAYASEKPELRAGKSPAIEIVKIKPSAGDLRKAKEKHKSDSTSTNQDEQVHVVKIYVTMPPARGKGWNLYVGDTKIEEYGGFGEGIFFKVYDPKDLDALKGKPIRFRMDDQVVDLGVNLPGKPAEKAGDPPELKDALKSK